MAKYAVSHIDFDGNHTLAVIEADDPITAIHIHLKTAHDWEDEYLKDLPEDLDGLLEVLRDSDQPTKILLLDY